jgi:hypothetical protein
METTTDLAALNQRLTRLEGQNRRLGMVCRYVDPRGSLISGFSLERSGVALVNYDQNGRLQSSSNALKPDAGLLGPTR